MRMTILRGEVIARNGEPVGQARGRLVRAQHAPPEPASSPLAFVRELDEALAVTPEVPPVFLANA
jgi:hypothetical protein